MNFSINYDFKANWDTEIKPLLDNKKVKASITRGVNKYLNNFDNNTTKYKKNTVPASYSSKDGYYMLMCKKEDILMEQLKKDKLLPKKY